MKIYIRSSEDKPKRTLSIELEIVAFVDELAVTASEETYNLPIANKQIAEDIAIDYQQIVDAVTSILHAFGFYEMSHHKSDDSNSLYFYFCRETEFDIEEVNLIIGMRVSDHDPPMWRSDKSKNAAEGRFRDHIQRFADDHRYLNNSLSSDPERVDESIPVAPVYVKYENKFYNVYEDVFRKIREKLRKFKKDYNIP